MKVAIAAVATCCAVYLGLIGLAAGAVDGRVLGIHGLTLRRGRHSFTHLGTTRWTWCAFDSIGVPAALQLTAIAASDCPTCGHLIAVHIRDGGLDDEAAVLWLPAPRPSGHLMNDFCSSADLYCSTNHLEAGAPRRGPDGRAVSLSDALEIGRETWSDIIDVDLATFVAGPGSAR